MHSNRHSQQNTSVREYTAKALSNDINKMQKRIAKLTDSITNHSAEVQAKRDLLAQLTTEHNALTQLRQQIG